MVSALFDLDDRVAVVTGGGGRLGGAAARALAEAGARVVVCGRNPNRLHDVAAPLGATPLRVDLGEPASIAALFDEVTSRLGGTDVLVNAAGISSAQGFGDTGSDEFAHVWTVNVLGPLLCAQEAVKTMRRRGGGKIVNVGSIYGTVGADQRIYEGADMVRSSPAYAASKSGLVNLTRDLAVRLASDNIQVNLVSPGGIEAGQPASFRTRYEARTPAGRMATPADVVGTIVYLSSAASDYVTGQNIHVDGGFTAW